MADTTPQQHAEALEMALAALPPELNALGVYNFDAWTSYVHAANPGAIRSLLDERKRLREALDELRAQVEALRADAERYRFMRHPYISYGQHKQIMYAVDELSEQLMDEAIDAARSQEDKR